MTLWIDAHISPTIAPWLQEKFGIEAIPVRDLDLLLWITCGNTSNARLKDIFTKTFQDACDLLAQGESLVEISDAQ